MTLPKPAPGLVINYSFLWPHEADRGNQEGAKDRPCAIVIAAQSSGEILVVPISHTKPHPNRNAIELPAKTKQRLGLDDEPSWVITDSLNRFTWPGPDVKPIKSGNTAFGHLPHALTTKIREEVLAHYSAKTGRIISRND